LIGEDLLIKSSVTKDFSDVLSLSIEQSSIKEQD